MLREFIEDMWPAIIFNTLLVLAIGMLVVYVLSAASGGVGNLF